MQYSAVAGSYLQYSMACGVEGTQTRSIVLALTILMLLRAGYLAEGMNHTVHRKVKQYRRQREDESAGVPTNGTDMELVIARYSEPDINWLKDVPEFYRVTVYNKVRILGLLHDNSWKISLAFADCIHTQCTQIRSGS